MQRLFCLLLAGMLTVCWVSPTWAVFCEQCRGRVHDNQFGTCRNCGQKTRSTNHRLCPECSNALHRCERCGKLIVKKQGAATKPPTIDRTKTGTYKFKDWAYRYEVKNAKTPQVSVRGRLAHNGKELPDAKINDYYKTPWGFMYFHGKPQAGRRKAGWIQTADLQSDRKGTYLKPPAGLSQRLSLTDADNGKTITVTDGGPIQIQLKGNPTTGYRWQLEHVKGVAVKSILARPTYQTDPAKQGMVGVGGTFTFQFKAVKLGTSTIKCVYTRGRSAYGKPAKSFSVTIKVQAK